MSDLKRVIYASRPFGFDEGMLNGILLQARHHNPRDNITGALICRADVYLQLLEGPAPAIDALFAKISRDNRHMEVDLRVSEPAEHRLFPAWAMRDDPARTWLWTPAEIDDGAIVRASRDDLLAVFARLAAEAPVA